MILLLLLRFAVANRISIGRRRCTRCFQHELYTAGSRQSSNKRGVFSSSAILYWYISDECTAPSFPFFPFFDSILFFKVRHLIARWDWSDLRVPRPFNPPSLCTPLSHPSSLISSSSWCVVRVCVVAVVSCNNVECKFVSSAASSAVRSYCAHVPRRLVMERV